MNTRYIPEKGDLFVPKYERGTSSLDGYCLRLDSIFGDFIFYSILSRPKSDGDTHSWSQSDEALNVNDWSFTKVTNIP